MSYIVTVKTRFGTFAKVFLPHENFMKWISDKAERFDIMGYSVDYV